MSAGDEKKINVLLLIKGLGLGGAEMLLEMAAPHLDRDRFNYQIGYFLPWKDALVERLERSGLPVHCFDVTSSFSIAGVHRLTRFCVDHEISVLHAHLPMPGVMGRIAGRRAKVPVIVYSEHNLWPRLNPVSRMLNRLTFSMNDRAIAVSQDVADSISPRFVDRVEVINNGIDVDAVLSRAGDRHATRQRLGMDDDCILIGKVANLTPKKNHELLIDAFAQLHHRVPNSRLLLVGQYANRDTILRQRTRDLGIEHAVIFNGPSTDIPSLLHAVDLFAMSSNFEGLPIALLEAMSMGKPTVCTSVGGIPQVVRDGTEGFLVPAGDTRALANRLEQLANDIDLRNRMSQASQTRIREKFDIRSMVSNVEKVYSDVFIEKKRVSRQR